MSTESVSIEWDQYAITYLARSFSVVLVGSLVFALVAAIVPGPAWWVLGLGGVVIALGSLFVLFWTVAEMIEDRLPDTTT